MPTEQARRKRARENAECLPGLEHVHRYWDRDIQRLGAKIMPGEYFVSMSGEPIATVLGSCVAVCVRDRVFGIGGMNHIMLPENGGGGPIDEAARYGAFAMEALINMILGNGGSKNNLELKVFGGGRMLNSVSDVGQKNIDFVYRYIATEGYTITAADVGGDRPRKVIYLPDQGRVRVRKLEAIENTEVANQEAAAKRGMDTAPPAGDIELFD